MPFDYSSTTIRERLESAASQNVLLLQTISETSYATSEYQQTSNFINDLRKQIALDEKMLAELNLAVDIEYAQHEKYRDSHVRRLSYKIGGKKDYFEADATKEEKEWLDAVAVQMQTKKMLEHLKVKLARAVKKNADLMDVMRVRTTAGLELDALYRSVFDGPTPEIPEENEKEKGWLQAETHFNTVGILFNTEKQAYDILVDADKFLDLAIRDIISARTASGYECWGVGGVWTDMSENNPLVSCEGHVRQVEMLIKQAQRIQPAVQSIGDMRVAQMSFMTNMVFDKIFSDLQLRDRIKQSQAQLKIAQARLVAELQSSKERSKALQIELDEAKAGLDQNRAELQKARSSAFERLASERRLGEWGASTPDINGEEMKCSTPFVLSF